MDSYVSDAPMASEEFDQICEQFFGRKLAPYQPTDGVDLDKLLQITQNTAMSNSALSKQMGVMSEKVAGDSLRIDKLETRMAKHEQTVTLTGYQAKQVYGAVHSRVADLLREDGGSSPYYGRFCRKCWTDAKKHSKMAQDYKFTLQADFDEVMDFIDQWYPHGYSGADGYKAHLDQLAKQA